MWVQRAGQNANTATINTSSNKATAISMTPNCGESLVMNQLATNPAAISSRRASQLIMVSSYAVADDGVERSGRRAGSNDGLLVA
jgi:hypothetical protein